MARTSLVRPTGVDCRVTEGRRDRPPTVEDVRELLVYVNADCSHDLWVEIAMAIKSGLGEAGWPVFEEWSQTGRTYDPRTCRATWDSIKASGSVTYGTLVHHARADGWRPSKRNTRRTGSRPHRPGRTLPRARGDAVQDRPPTRSAARSRQPPRWPAPFWRRRCRRTLRLPVSTWRGAERGRRSLSDRTCRRRCAGWRLTW